MSNEPNILEPDLAARLQKHQEELSTLDAAIKSYDSTIHALKPHVVEYNETLRKRKELRREHAAKQKTLKILADFLNGTTLFDSRFPLFAKPNMSTPSTISQGETQ